jgi:RND family efflux transporter MFP subunit
MKTSLLSLLTALNLAAISMAHSQAAKPMVQVANVSEQTLKPVRALPGTITASSQARLATQVAGRLTYLAALGSQLKKGDVVARLDDGPSQLSIARERARLSRLDAELALAERQSERFRSLATAISPAQQEEADVRVQVLAAQRSEAKVALKMAELEFAETKIRAPFAGQLSAHFRQLGEHAGVGEAVVQLTDDQQRELSVAVPIEIARWASPGKALALNVELPATATLQALVPGPEQSRQMQARLRLDASLDLPIGYAVEVQWPSAAPERTLTVPQDAIVRRSEGNHLVKIQDGRAQRVVVQLGASVDGHIAVSGPLKLGDSVVVRGAESLAEGVEVDTQPAPSEAVAALK